MTPAQHICHLSICIHQSLAYICNKNDHICCINGDLGLLPHLCKDQVTAVRLYTACIDHGKCPIKPGNICVDPVSCYTGGILYNGNPAPGKYIKKCGFAYIRPSHYSNYRFAHTSVSF